MDVARAVAALSKDRSTKVGVIILGSENEIRSVGYNGFTRGLDDTLETRHERPEKYFWAEHGERNAIYNAARIGIPLSGCTMLIAAPVSMCMDCARAVVQSGIKKVILEQEPDVSTPVWGEHAIRIQQLFKESNVELVFLDQIKEDE